MDSPHFLSDLLHYSLLLYALIRWPIEDLSSFYSAVPLGSTDELPAKSCAEIKASEGKAMAYGKYWIYSDEDVNQAIQATCEGNSLSVNQSHSDWSINQTCICFFNTKIVMHRLKMCEEGKSL